MSSKWIFFLLILLCWGCGSETPSTPSTSTNNSSTRRSAEAKVETQKSSTLIFIDKTVSAGVDDAWLDSYRSKIADLVAVNFGAQGSQLTGHFVHSNTLGVPPFLEETFTEPAPEGLDDMPKVKRIREEKGYQKKQQEAQEPVITAIVDNLRLEDNEQTNRSTDLWGTLEIASRAFQNAPADAAKELVYISDMMESVRGKGRRDFHQRLPRDKAEAQQFATEDARWIQQELTIDPSALQGVSVKVWPPAQPLDASAIQLLRYYWEGLFEEMGFGEVEFF